MGTNRGERHGRRRVAACIRPALLAALVVSVGCGKKGPPRPPEPRGPLRAAEVGSRQIGLEFVVRAVVPAPRGDQPTQQIVRADVVRVAFAPGVEPPGDPDVFRRRGVRVAWVEGDPLVPEKAVRMVDRKPVEFPGGGVGGTLRYAVVMVDRRGRPSGLAVAPDLLPVEAPPAPTAPRGEPTVDGVRLTWEPVGEGARRYNVYRTSGDTWPEVPLNAEPLEVAEFLDTTAPLGAVATYTVRAAVGGGPPWRESADSAKLILTVEDRIAPAKPEGLVAVQEGAAVRLFWNPNDERDLAGYRVYRKLPGAEWQRVGPDVVERPLYLDGTLPAGQTAAYRVTALDRAQPPNESDPSPEVVVELGAEPQTPGPEPE